MESCKNTKCSKEQKVVLALVGGSALEQIPGANIIATHDISTPFGSPSAPVLELSIESRTVFFIARHGRCHEFSPSEVNYRANVYALKSLGVTDAVAVSSVGILRDGIEPSDIILCDQVFDRTTKRASTFFEGGAVAHVSIADPFCENLRKFFLDVCRRCSFRVHDGGTLVSIEGPSYSSRAESLFYKNVLQATCVGMTALPETRLFKEAGICFITCAMATDYDCWKTDTKAVSSDMVVQTGVKNNKIVQTVLKEFISSYPHVRSRCVCQDSLKEALVTKNINKDLLEKLSILFN